MSDVVFIKADEVPWERIETERFKNLLFANLITSQITKDLSLHLAKLQPGGVVEIHAHDDLVDAFYVIEGEVTAFVGDETTTWKTGDFAWIPPKISHGQRNDSDKPVFIFELFAPALV
ncbi:MAG: cupin domain-containing protein [Chloroflexi bacterium]|nr:cupin domain-containing protein [Chloroflexota bacterium]